MSTFNPHEKKTVLGHLGEVRRSKLTQSYGPGAIIDFSVPGSGELVSAVVSGLEGWDEAAHRHQQGLHHPQRIYEPRLQQTLKVEGFRTPPTRVENRKDSDDVLPAYRFPLWLQCPQCHVIQREGRWKRGKVSSHPGRYCSNCFTSTQSPVAVIPVWLVVACESGHLDEFPWARWAGCVCTQGQEKLKIEQRGAGLAGRYLHCTKQGCPGQQGRSLHSVFMPKDFLAIQPRCQRGMPWLGDGVRDEAPCDCLPVVIQRTASNAYYAVTQSALRLPTETEAQEEKLYPYLSKIRNIDKSNWLNFFQMLQLDEDTGLSFKAIHAFYERALLEDSERTLEEAELDVLLQATKSDIEQGDFSAHPASALPLSFKELIQHVVHVPRLHEVRALTGFTRVKPLGGDFGGAQKQPLSRTSKKWLPATEIRGEGIFLRLDEDAVRAWERQEVVQLRLKQLHSQILKEDTTQANTLIRVTARRVLTHSLSHALMRQLSNECGYSSSALNERLYVYEDTHESPCAAVLIYTGASDADGTLGGLVRRARGDLLNETLLGALEEAMWCASDPICLEEPQALSVPHNLSACHACLLVAETSCGEFNHHLDRAMLVGTPEHPKLGFFHTIIAQL